MKVVSSTRYLIPTHSAIERRIHLECSSPSLSSSSSSSSSTTSSPCWSYKSTITYVNPIRHYDELSLIPRTVWEQGQYSRTNSGQVWQRMPKYKVASYPYSVSCTERGNESRNEAK